MAVTGPVVRIRAGGGARVERLVCHPALPLAAGLDSERPAVHVWDLEAGAPRRLATIGGGSAAYADVPAWEPRPEPGLAWHPCQPLLLVAGHGTVARWEPGGISDMAGLAPAASYRHLAFSPGGQTLWAWPSPGATEDAWQPCGDAVDLASGTIRACRGWDTGIAVHPGGGLVATLRSDQGATLGVFARVGHESTPAVMRMLSRALIMDADGYQTPVFSAGGRYLAIRGNAYENSLDVFGFPALNRVLATTLGQPYPGHPPPRGWQEQYRAWSRHNIAFAAQPGVLWVGTPDGSLVEVDLDNERAARHDVLPGAGVTALSVMAAGDLIAATGDGDLALIAVAPGAGPARPAGARPPRDLVTAFLATSREVPEGGRLADHLVMTDGTRTWEPGSLDAVTAATAADPAWLRLRAAVNKAMTGRDQP